MNQVWLGIDPGLAIIGWAVMKESNNSEPFLLDYGNIETDKGLPTPKRLLEIEQDLTDLIAEFKPNNIAMEMPFFGRQIKAAGKVLQAVGVINLVIYREIGCLPVMLHQASWKCHLGNGKATKSEVAEMLQGVFDLKKLPGDDYVDAIGIAYAALCGLRNEIS